MLIDMMKPTDNFGNFFQNTSRSAGLQTKTDKHKQMNGYNMICEIALKYRHRLKKAILSNS
jgi:hypothetical protein